MRVLAVGAHPDDLEILAAGTLARFQADGHHVTMCHVASANRGSYHATMEETAATRLAEAASSAGPATEDTTMLCRSPPWTGPEPVTPSPRGCSTADSPAGR